MQGTSDEFIDPSSEPERQALVPSCAAAAGEVRCRTCGWHSFERFGTATVTHAIRAVADFSSEVTIMQTAPPVANDDFELIGYRCTLCGAGTYDFADLAEGRPWMIGARAVLPDGTETIVVGAGPDRILGSHREPTAICAGATYLLRELQGVDSVHPDQLAFVV
jgi:hypothetical protein